ncbi:MAG: PASTA domain-containing protein, partial [Proteobacteria bacterium]|nr:PASTA domain-containing protein [Pseudomonadota bacterium]
MFAALLLIAVCARAQNPPQHANCNSASIGISLLMHRMPDLKGCSSPEIETTLQQMKLAPKLVPVASSEPANQIVDQKPDAYTKWKAETHIMAAETPIILYVSEGPTT